MGCFSNKDAVEAPIKLTAKMANSVISTTELESMLDNKDLRLVDCSTSMGKEEDCRVKFHQCHIKGAILLDLDYCKDMNQNLPFMMPSEKYF